MGGKTKYEPSTLHNALKYYDRVGFIRHILQAGADPHVSNMHGFSPLHELCRSAGDDNDSSTISLVRLLLEHGANPNEVYHDRDPVDGSWFPLHTCVLRNATGLARVLLEEGGADPNQRGESTPLICAARLGHARLVECLLHFGADVNAVDRKYGRTALQWTLLQRSTTGYDDDGDNHRRQVALLLVQHESIQVSPPPCSTSFALQTRPSDRQPKGRIEDWPVLHLAVVNQWPEVVRLILDRSPKKDLNGLLNHRTVSEGYTPLHVACRIHGNSTSTGHVRKELVQLLLHAGADPALPDKHGNGPLHTVAASSSSEKEEAVCLSRQLIQQCRSNHATSRNLLLGMKNVRGLSPLHMAAVHGNLAVATLLALPKDEKHHNDRGDQHRPRQQKQRGTLRLTTTATTNEDGGASSLFDHGLSPILLAARKGNASMVMLLLQAACGEGQISFLPFSSSSTGESTTSNRKRRRNENNMSATCSGTTIEKTQPQQRQHEGGYPHSWRQAVRRHHRHWWEHKTAASTTTA